MFFYKSANFNPIIKGSTASIMSTSLQISPLDDFFENHLKSIILLIACTYPKNYLL